METKIRKIGNSSGIILPKALIDKYDLSEVIIEDHGDGIMIKPAKRSVFHLKLEEAKKNKSKIYAEMKSQASMPETSSHYEQELKELDDIDTEIFD